MYKKILPIALAAALLLSACGKKDDQVEPVAPDTGAGVEEVEPPAESNEIITEEVPEGTQPVEDASISLAEKFEASLVDLQENEYEGLKVEAFIKERKAILAGQSFNVSVIITNEGDKTIAYTHGSGTSSVPDALYVYSHELQTLIPEVDLGPSTADYQTKFLAPGETQEYVYTVMAIAPVADILKATLDYQVETGEYIGNATAETLAEKFPYIQAVPAGSYEMDATLKYLVLPEVAEGEEITLDPTVSATGYTTAKLQVGITG